MAAGAALDRSIAKKEKEQKRLVRSRRILWTAMVGGILASLVYLVAMGTTHWVTLDIPTGVYRNASSAYVLKRYSGLFRICRVELHNSTLPYVKREYCRMLKFFPSQQVIDDDEEIDYGILDYNRTEAAFSVISVLLSAIANFFTWYSLKQLRYMFKRLAGSLHLITAACVLVCLEVFKSSLDYEKSHLPARYPASARHSYDFSFCLAWVSFALYVIVGITMFIMSHKRKGDRATCEKEALENEPVHLGRL